MTIRANRAPCPAPHGERGSVLLAMLILLAATAATSVALLSDAASAAGELRTRRDVLCARYAALGGLALGGPATAAAGLVGPAVVSLDVALVRLAPNWCVRRATASCGRAVRTLSVTLADPAACAPAAP